MNRLSELQAHDGQNSEKAGVGMARPEIVDPGASCGLFFHSEGETIAPIPANDPVWFAWWSMHGDQPIGIKELRRLDRFRGMDETALFNELRTLAASGECVELPGGLVARLRITRNNYAKLRVKREGQNRHTFTPRKRRLSFSPDKFIYRSELAL